MDKEPKRPLPPEAYEDSPIKCSNCGTIMQPGTWHQQGNRFTCKKVSLNG